MASRKLAVVPEGAAVPKPERLTVRQAADQSERALLVSLRQKIAGEIDAGVPAHALAPLSRQLRDIAREIEALDMKHAQEADEDVAEDEAWDASAI